MQRLLLFFCSAASRTAPWGVKADNLFRYLTSAQGEFTSVLIDHMRNFNRRILYFYTITTLFSVAFHFSANIDSESADRGELQS